MRHLLLACCFLGLTAGVAAAKPARVPATDPARFIFVSGAGVAADHVQSLDSALVACATAGRVAIVKLRVTLRWNRAGQVTTVGALGGTAALNRCVARVLRGSIAGASGAGSATVRFALRRAAPGALDTCKVDGDCTVYFRRHACVPTDPLAIATTKLVAARAQFPMSRVECGMGGPQFDRLQRESDRWSASCVKARCTLVENPVAGF